MYQVSCKRGLVLIIGILISICICLYIFFYFFPNMSREEKEGGTKWWGVEGFLQALAPKYIDNILTSNWATPLSDSVVPPVTCYSSG